MIAQPKPEPADAPTLVVFGRDATGKPHASSFSQSEADLATKAAELMGLRPLPVQTDMERALAAKVPRGGCSPAGGPSCRSSRHRCSRSCKPRP